MGKLRSGVGMAMIWLLTVAGVSASAWVAIDRAGREISDPGATSLAIPSLGSTAESATPSGGPTSTVATPAPSASRTTAAPATTRPTAIPKSSRSPSPPGNTPANPVRSTTSIDRTVLVTGGQVSVRCTGAVITLRIAQPDNGWRVDVEGSGPVKVEVSFQQGDAEGGAQAHVEAVCSRGTPVFSVDNSS